LFDYFISFLLIFVDYVIKTSKNVEFYVFIDTYIILISHYHDDDDDYVHDDGDDVHDVHDVYDDDVHDVYDDDVHDEHFCCYVLEK
jgi:hypothetical protein